jgi:transposase
LLRVSSPARYHKESLLLGPLPLRKRSRSRRAQAHRFLVLDKAGWHTGGEVELPQGIHLEFLPSHSPELQPAERLWPLTNEALAKRLFENLDELEARKIPWRTSQAREYVLGACSSQPYPGLYERIATHQGWLRLIGVRPEAVAWSREACAARSPAHRSTLTSAGWARRRASRPTRGQPARLLR